MNWTPRSARNEIERLVSILVELGAKDPFCRALQLVETEQAWSSPESQALWSHRFGFWDRVLSREPGGHANKQTGYALTISSDAMRSCLRDESFRRVFFEADGWNLHSKDGAFRIDRAEDLVEGRIGQLDLEPVQTNPSGDYDWLVLHPRDRLFQNGHQSGYQFMILALAHFHQPETRWVRQFEKMVLALIEQCPALPNGFSDTGKNETPGVPSNVAWAHYGYVANRLHFLLATYALLGDNPALQSPFHSVVTRLVRAHAEHLHTLGDLAYRDNYLNATGKALYLASTLLADPDTEDWQRAMWPLLIEGIGRELLDDGCHFHRSFSYHLTFVERPLSIVCLAEKMGRPKDLPAAFLEQITKAIRAFIQVSTPIRSTPGINDDWTGTTPYHKLLELAGSTLELPECEFLSTEGRIGTRPSFTSTLLPDAQLVVMRSDWSRDANYLLFNVSPDEGHHHPCPLSFQIWSGGQPLLIDPGVGHYYTGEREISRRSWWHNCPTLGAENLPASLSPIVLHFEDSPRLTYALGTIALSVGQDHGCLRFRRHVFFVEKSCWVIYDELLDLPEGLEVWENLHFANRNVVTRESGVVVCPVEDGKKGIAVVPAAEGWLRSEETASRWMTYGGRPQPTTLVHYHASTDTGEMGFGLLLRPMEDIEQWRDPDFRLHNHGNGLKTLTFCLDGNLKTCEIAK